MRPKFKAYFNKEGATRNSIKDLYLIIMANYTSKNKKQNKCDTSCVEMSSESINGNRLNLYNTEKMPRNWNRDVRLRAHLKKQSGRSANKYVLYIL